MIADRAGALCIEVWHNLRWSRYKAGVFAVLARLAADRGDKLHIVHIADTDDQRTPLAVSAADAHAYPHSLLFAGNYHALWPPRLWVAVARAAWTSRVDVTVLAGYSRPEYWVQAPSLALRGRRRAVFCDSTSADRRRGWLRRAVKQLFFRIVPVTLSYGERARAYAIAHGVRPERALLRCQAAALPAGYDAAAIPPLRAAGPQNGPRLLYVGRLSAEKGIDTLLHAFAAWRAHRPDATLRLVGAGPQRAALEALTARLGLGEAVAFAGPAGPEALAAEYLAAGALVLPSLSEPWGLVVNEALHYGCPVIVSDNCGCVPELVGDKSCGRSFTAGDVAALTVAFDALDTWALDPAATARQCLARIAPFTPAAAAAQMYAAIELVAAT